MPLPRSYRAGPGIHPDLAAHKNKKNIVLLYILKRKAVSVE